MPRCVSLMADRRGSSIVEFALVMPIIAYVMIGIIAYGQYFLIAHSVQQLANDAARATIAGLNSTERDALAQQSLNAELAVQTTLVRNRATLRTTETNGLVKVQVQYDASNVALLRSGLIPMPGLSISRTAVMRPGGIA